MSKYSRIPPAVAVDAASMPIRVKTVATVEAPAEAVATVEAVDPMVAVRAKLALVGNPNAKVTGVRSAIPKLAGSKAYAAYALYSEGLTVAEYCAAVKKFVPSKKGTLCLKYDLTRGLIDLVA